MTLTALDLVCTSGWFAVPKHSRPRCFVQFDRGFTSISKVSAPHAPKNSNHVWSPRRRASQPQDSLVRTTLTRARFLHLRTVNAAAVVTTVRRSCFTVAARSHRDQGRKGRTVTPVVACLRASWRSKNPTRSLVENAQSDFSGRKSSKSVPRRKRS